MTFSAIVSLCSNLFSAGAAYFGYAKQRDAEKNAPDVKAAAIATREQKDSDALAKAIANKDDEAIKNAISE